MPNNAIAVRNDDEETVEGTKLLFPNFEGRPSKYNPAGGVRDFLLCLDDDRAAELTNKGWNVKRLKPRDPDEPGQAYINVVVRFGRRPVRIVMITETTRKRTILNEETCFALDWAIVKFADVTIRARAYDVNGNKGIKAYLQTIYVIIKEDYLDLKWAAYDDMPPVAIANDERHYDYDGEVVGEYEHDDPLEIESGR